MSEFIRRVRKMTASECFQELSERLNQRGLLSVIGGDAKEQVHQQLLKWLLDPKSEHGLDTEPLRLFLEACYFRREEFQTASQQGFNKYPTPLALEKLTSLTLRNSGIVAEQKANGQQRIDLFIQYRIESGDYTKSRIGSIVIEMKVDHSVGLEQLADYRSWVEGNNGMGGQKLLLFLTKDHLPEADANPPVGWPTGIESRYWTPISWQMLYDEVVSPLLRSPRLSEHGRLVLEQWARSLQEIGVAVGPRENALIEELLNESGDVVSDLNETLSAAGQTIQTKVTLKFLLSHGCINSGQEVEFRDANNSVLKVAKIANEGKLGFEFENEFFTVARDAVRYAGGPYQAGYGDFIYFKKGDEEEFQSLNQLFENKVAELRAQQPDPNDVSFAGAIFSRYERVFRLVELYQSMN